MFTNYTIDSYSQILKSVLNSEEKLIESEENIIEEQLIESENVKRNEDKTEAEESSTKLKPFKIKRKSEEKCDDKYIKESEKSLSELDLNLNNLKNNSNIQESVLSFIDYLKTV